MLRRAFRLIPSYVFRRQFEYKQSCQILKFSSDCQPVVVLSPKSMDHDDHSNKTQTACVHDSAESKNVTDPLQGQSSVQVSSANSTPPQKQLYRRVLPKTCIAFGSSEGKQLFRESLLSGNLSGYFLMDI